MESRNYYTGCEAEIAREVVLHGRSAGWSIPYWKSEFYQSSKDAGKKAAKNLASFNIGYTDDMRGEWSQTEGGTPNTFDEV